MNKDDIKQIDLFEYPELIPIDVMGILSTHNEDADQYKELARLVGELEKVGYTFDYYLDADPYNLRKLFNADIKEYMNLHNSDEVGINNKWTFDEAEYHLLLSDKYYNS